MTKKKVMAGVLLACTAGLGLPARATDVGVSVQISQPGVYGRVDIGRFPQPQVVVAQPVIIAAPPFAAPRPQPVYMWVPPGHRKHWSQHCAQYRACGVPVYFVRDDWYERRVRPYGHGHDRDHDRRDDRGPGRGHGRGEGRGDGPGHGRGHDRRD